MACTATLPIAVKGKSVHRQAVQHKAGERYGTVQKAQRRLGRTGLKAAFGTAVTVAALADVKTADFGLGMD